MPGDQIGLLPDHLEGKTVLDAGCGTEYVSAWLEQRDHLTHGDWFKNLKANGFDIEDLIEIRPDEDASTVYPWVTVDWARRWPVEAVWKARKRGR